MATIKGQCMWGPLGFGVPPDDVVPPLIMALLTEIHYLFIQSPLDIKGECSQTTGFTTVKSYWCGFVSYSWKEVTVSSLSRDDSVGLRLGVAGVVFWLCLLLNSSFKPALVFLSPSVAETLFSPLKFSQSEGCTPCLCAVYCCSIACSPSRSSYIVVVVCLHWFERVTCICPDSLEGLSVVNRVGLRSLTTQLLEVIFTGVIFLFIILVNRLARDGIMCLSR